MGLSPVRWFVWVPLAALIAGSAFATPTLRLSESALGPISIAVGANGPQQRVEAYNVGDGQLALAVSTNADWLTPAVGPLTPCTTRAGNCYPITIALNTATLPQGTVTGVVVVGDPDAWDAPQTITVTVLMGGAVPNRVGFFVPPNGAIDELTFETNDELRANVATQNGGPWLSFSLEGSGSFRFIYPYRLQARHLAGLGEGTYDGSLNVTGSGFAPDIKNVPVTMRVTSEPIALVSPSAVEMQAAVDSLPPQVNVSVFNRGMGTLEITGTQVVTSDGGEWLAAEKIEGADVVALTTNLDNVVPGVLTANVTIESNAVNGPLIVPVTLEVVQQTGPVADFGGVVNNALWDQPIAQGGIASVFGAGSAASGQFSYQPPVQGTEIPLVTELGGAKVFVNGVETPLFFSSYGQVNFQMPFETPTGQARVQLTRDGQPGNVVTVEVAERAARLLRLNIGDYGIIVNQDGTFPIPTTPGIVSRPAKSGDALVIYAVGFGPTQPAVATGAPAPSTEPLARVVPEPTVYFGGGLLGGVAADPFFVGLTPGSVGLYQVNVMVPANAPRGDNIPLRVEGQGILSNTVELAIE